MQVSGSGPAYHYLAMEAMIDGAVQMGFNREVPLPPEWASAGHARAPCAGSAAVCPLAVNSAQRQPKIHRVGPKSAILEIPTRVLKFAPGL